MFLAVIDALGPEADSAAQKALFQAISEETTPILASFQCRPSWVSPRST
jgi:hypothetical protein